MIENNIDSKVTETKPRRKFDQAFKRQAVELWASSGKSARQIAEELGIRMALLHRWKAELVSAPPPASPSEVQAELIALRRENALLRQQRDILKKTLGIISEPPSSATSASKL